jgi:CRP-like cAMP-binding protein
MDRLGDRNDDGDWFIDAPVTHQDIASSVNLTRETVSRAMERMKRRGYIAYDDKRRIVIKSIPGLMKIIGNDEAISMWPELARYAP